ncbi:MAG: DegT/DnrJ/EryC1/StrS family aminotransferase [Flavobacteriales bacterium]|nr:DegT/DnrJ/EryC1/StrS family aminotransferase [Flavobacteriales bacterium]
MNVPFVDLKAQYQRYKSEIDSAIAQVIDQTAFISGKHAAAFEANFSDYTGVANTVACANGTDSLEIILNVLGVGPGDEVIVPAISWISTSEAVGTRGATPVFVDIDETYTIDPTKIEAAITPKTRGIIPVHLYGCPANMPAIMAIAEKHELFVFEDCAQSHGAEINDQRIATFGTAASFSFYPGKNLGAYGDAGAMATDSEEIATKARMIANHGQKAKHQHFMEGRNSRMDGIHAAILNVKIPHIETWTDQRIAHAKRYCELIDTSKYTVPFTPENARHVYHLFVIQTDKRDEVMAHLKDNDIQCAIHYPTPLPFLPCYDHLGHQEADFPVAANASKRILSLPIYPEMTEDHIAYVAATLNKFNG